VSFITNYTYCSQTRVIYNKLYLLLADTSAAIMVYSLLQKAQNVLKNRIIMEHISLDFWFFAL